MKSFNYAEALKEVELNSPITKEEAEKALSKTKAVDLDYHIKVVIRLACRGVKIEDILIYFQLRELL